MGKFLTRVDALRIPQVTVLCGRCRVTALTAKKICLDILHQSSGSVNFGRFGLGRRPSYPTGYRPVWLSLGHCPHSQGNQVGFSPPVSWIGNFLESLCRDDALFTPRVTVPCDWGSFWLSSQEDLSGYSPPVSWVGISLLHQHSKPSQLFKTVQNF